MNLIQVDISDCKISDRSDDTLITYALGSCIAVMLYDPVRVAGGMLHFMLPLSKTSPAKAEERPAMFADTGVPQLFNKMYSIGCKKKDLIVRITGGGKLFEDHGVFDIGKRNYTVLRQIFWKNNIMITSEDIGGQKSRTALLEIATGRVLIRSQRKEIVL